MSTQTKAKPVRKKVLTAAEMRSRAAFRAMEKLLEQNIEGEAQLWAVARVMSGDEYLQAAEERFLGGGCGNARCASPAVSQPFHAKLKVDPRASKDYEASEGAGYCGIECQAAAAAFAQRLGSASQAMHRFELLLEKVREKKRQGVKDAQAAAEPRGGEELAAAAEAAEKPESGPPSSEPGALNLKGVLKKKSKLAAGTAKTPIMAAEVKERQPSGAAAPPKTPSARKAHAVEGYVPRAALKKVADDAAVASSGEKRRVRFNNAVETSSATTLTLKEEQEASRGPSCGMAATGYGWGAEQQHQQQGRGSTVSAAEQIAQQQQEEQQRAVFVLDVDDADGPIEGSQHALEAKFGSLRLAGAEELEQAGLPVAAPELLQQPAPAENSAGETAAGAAAGGPSVDEILAARLRQGASKYFPQLAATLPPELNAALSDSGSDAGDSEGSEDWMLSDDEEGSDSDGDLAAYRPKLSFFGELIAHLEVWVTDATLSLLRSGPETPAPPSNSDSIPEIRNALGRFLGLAVHPVAEALQVALPRSEVERAVHELLQTFRLASALPAFSSSQWRLVALVLMKALSMERSPGMRPAFETREGVRRVNVELAAHAFTGEEFVALLEQLLCCEE